MLVLKAVDLRLLRRDQRLPKRLILLFPHRAVDIIRRPLVVTGGKPGFFHVNALKRHQRRRRVEKIERMPVSELRGDGVCQRVARQRTGGDDNVPLCGDLRHLALHYRNVGVAAHLLRHQCGEAVTVNGKRAAGLHLRFVGTGEDQRAEAAQLLLEQSHRVFQPVGAQGVGAAQLGKIVALMRRCALLRFHFIERDADAASGKLPRSLTAGKSRSDHRYLHDYFSFLTVFFAAAFLAIVFLAAVFFSTVFLAPFSAAGVSPAGFSSAVSAASAFLRT